MDLVTILTVAVAVTIALSVYFLFNGVPSLKNDQRRPSRR